jgi:SPP1 family predicted phage head-tail adaptor
MRAGKLDRLITIQRATETVAPSGATASEWFNIATVHAEILQSAGSEAPTPFGEAETDTITFRVRWIPSDEITTADRIAYAGHHYNLKKVAEIGRRIALELTCERKTP